MKMWNFLKACSDLVTLTYNNRRINTTLDKLGDDQETMQTIIDNIPRAVFWKGKDLGSRAAIRFLRRSQA